ncbi:MAG: nucleotidyltransferase family protein [Ruminococcaceae bacterium]|jgi:predicted nucleotidyltransferase|nr:nucleotidyltransferase family protein [Oscillospiraceae bacterium]
MAVVGIICEYNPLHRGHERMLHLLRQQGYEGIVCAMSGHFVQRGEAAVVGKLARAEMALRCGADLVLEIPTPWAAATAERFARGGVEVLRQTGVVDTLAFGAECADAVELTAVADTLDSGEYRAALCDAADDGVTFAARRQRAVAAVLGPERAAVLAQPNNTLAVEYLRCLRGTGIKALALPRQGAGHDAPQTADGIASASRVRQLLLSGETEQALSYMPESAAVVLRRELASGRAPADMRRCDRAILARLRRMEEEEWARYDGGGEGLYRRLYQAVQQSASVDEVLQRAKTKRYPMARLRRMVLSAWLELPAPSAHVPYLRLLGASGTGRRLLRQMSAPVLTKAADVTRLGAEAAELFRQESRWSDLYTLACPVVAPCGEDWRMTPILVSD